MSQALITDVHLETLRSTGFVVVQDVLTEDEVRRAREAVFRHLPSAEDYEASPGRFAWLRDDEWAGSRNFPFPEVEANLVAVHPQLIDAATRFLGTDQIILNKGNVWGKYAGAAHYEQVLHYDYPNHTLVVPRQDAGFSQVCGFVYLTDVTEELGATRIVPRPAAAKIDVAYDEAAGGFFASTHPSASDYPELYDAEEAATGTAGSILLFTPDIYHRAGRVTASTGMRLTIGFAFSARRPWLGFQSWPRFGEDREMIDFLVACTPRQREVLGFPAIGDPYWTDETLAGVASRFPGMDLSPYALRSIQ